MRRRYAAEVNSTTEVPLSGFLFDQAAARELGPEWLAADLHVHTHFSADVLPVPESDPRKLLERARRLGLAYVSFTDHMTMDACDLVGWEREGLIRGVAGICFDPSSTVSARP